MTLVLLQNEMNIGQQFFERKGQPTLYKIIANIQIMIIQITANWL